ncbi:hypothetical protein G9A89_012193 [Geosiphon pyriformis]|nr:hypothetical protein G9A89_012193 [Geosiphon pyriformis]
MDLIGLFVGGSSSVLAGLGTRSNNKKKAHVESVYSHGPLYKKPKTLGASNGTVDSSTGPIAINVLQADDMECKMSWSSKVKSKDASVSGVSDIENINNMVAEETSYVDSNDFEADNMVDNTTLRKTQTRMYVLGQPPKKSSFNNASNIDDVLELSSHTFNGSNQLPLVKLCALKTHSFNSTKSFALDVEHFAIPGNSISENALTLSKFPGIIRSTFTSEFSLNKAKLMAINKKVVVNTDFRKVNSHMDQKIIIKKISVDLPRSAIEAVFSKFGKIISVKLQLVGFWQKTLVEYESSEMADLVAARWSVLVGKNSVHVVKAISDKQMWILRDQHQVLLYTLPVGTTAHDLSGLFESYGRKTCFIGHNPFLYVHDWCAVICFENETSKLAAVGLIPVFKSVNLHWAGLCLAYCTQCTHFGYITANCSVNGSSGVRERQMVSDQNCVCLAVIYKKKSASVSRLILFGGRTWMLVVSPSGSIDNGKPLPPVVNNLEKQLVSIKSSLVSLMEQIGELAKRLESLMLAVSQPSPEWKDIVMGVGLGESTCNETAVATATATYTVKNFSMSPHIVKLENMLEGLAASVLSLSACFNDLALAAGTLSQPPSQ